MAVTGAAAPVTNAVVCPCPAALPWVCCPAVGAPGAVAREADFSIAASFFSVVPAADSGTSDGYCAVFFAVPVLNVGSI